jgi:hypothetical protein
MSVVGLLQGVFYEGLGLSLCLQGTGDMDHAHVPSCGIQYSVGISCSQVPSTDKPWWDDHVCMTSNFPS